MDKRRRRTPEQVGIGKRMKAAAVQAGLGMTEIARHLGVYPPTVYRWWSGERAPSTETMRVYAGLVGKPVGFFYGEDEAEPHPREIVDFLLGWAGLLMAGEEPGAAFDRVTGEPEELTPREREKLAAAAHPMREDLARLSGGDWNQLTEEQQRQILQQIAQIAGQRRSPPEEGQP